MKIDSDKVMEQTDPHEYKPDPSRTTSAAYTSGTVNSVSSDEFLHVAWFDGFDADYNDQTNYCVTSQNRFPD